MEKQILFNDLEDNRLMKTDGELEIYENAISSLADICSIKDLYFLIKGFDDDTDCRDVMFGLVHLIESFYKQNPNDYVNFILLNTNEFKARAIWWLKIIITRLLNDDDSLKILLGLINNINVDQKEILFHIFSNLLKDELYAEKASLVLKKIS